MRRTASGSARVAPSCLRSSRREVHRWQTVVRDGRRRPGRRSSSSCCQQTSAAGAHRADHRRRQDRTTLRPGMRLPADVRDLANRLHGAQPRRAGKGPFQVQAGGPGSGLAGGRQRSPGAVHESRPAQLPLPRASPRNNSGVWNEHGDALEFSIAPAYYQTNWFRASCVAAFLALLWAAYQLRVRQLQHQFNMRLEARVDERTRIARELHDTLLQSFQGLMFSFPGGAQPASGAHRRGHPHARQGHRRGAERSPRAAIRCKICGPTGAGEQSGGSVRAVGKELARSSGGGRTAGIPGHCGRPAAPLSPLLRDEVYRIAREVLRNAFRTRAPAAYRGGNHVRRAGWSACGFGMMERASTEGPRAEARRQGPGDCRACASAPNAI